MLLVLDLPEHFNATETNQIIVSFESICFARCFFRSPTSSCVGLGVQVVHLSQFRHSDHARHSYKRVATAEHNLQCIHYVALVMDIEVPRLRLRVCFKKSSHTKRRRKVTFFSNNHDQNRINILPRLCIVTSSFPTGIVASPINIRKLLHHRSFIFAPIVVHT